MKDDSASFRGDVYDIARDHVRLSRQQERIIEVMVDKGFFSLHELQQLTGYMDGSISRHIRFLTEPRHGGYIKKKKLKEGTGGTWLYSLSSPPKTVKPLGIVTKADGQTGWDFGRYLRDLSKVENEV